MKKLWKIILLVILFLVIAFIGFVIYNGYNYYGFYDKAENLGSMMFGRGSVNETINGKVFSTFNSKLSNCDLSYGGQSVAGESWEIRGIENDKCLVIYREPKINYGEDSATISYITYVCKLPREIYSYPEKIEWSEILENNYCSTN